MSGARNVKDHAPFLLTRRPSFSAGREPSCESCWSKISSLLAFLTRWKALCTRPRAIWRNQGRNFAKLAIADGESEEITLKPRFPCQPSRYGTAPGLISSLRAELSPIMTFRLNFRSLCSAFRTVGNSILGGCRSGPGGVLSWCTCHFEKAIGNTIWFGGEVVYACLFLQYFRANFKHKTTDEGWQNAGYIVLA